ncbi:MAG: beta-lactamase family protein [Pyrinomonadaceae bacterium]|nr:beta-lactamase family protein [Pyrinomonadaceae bacterium]
MLKKIKISIILMSLFAQFSTVAFSNSETEKKLKDYLHGINAYGFSGQVLIAENGKISLNQAYGFADRESKIPNSLNTVFNVASLTKQFTATAILRLEAAGKLKTSDAISKYLENVPSDKSTITIHQLLTHTSGMSRGQDGKKNSMNRDEVVAKILQLPLIAKVGEKFIYSNNAYHLLAAIIERVSGKNYSQYIRENLFKPAGMMQSGFYQDEKWKPYLVAQSYNEWTKLPAFTEWNKAWNYGAGAIISNTTDLFKWFKALSEYQILPKDETEKLFQKYTESFDQDTFYGYGWYLEKLKNGKTLIYHGGDNQGYHSEFRWYRDDNRIIIILTNYETLEPDGVAIQKRVIANNLNRILSSEEYKQPPNFAKLSAKDLKKYEGEYRFANGEKVKIWSNGEYLEIGAEGQEVINAIAGYEGETAKKYSEANDLTKFILENIKQNDLEKIKTKLGKDDYDFYIPFLAGQIKEFKEKLGELKEIKIQGTASFPWDADNYRTSVILHFEKGTTDLFLGYQNGKLNDVTTETGRPFPLIMPFVPNSKTEFSTFEFLRAKTTNFKFEVKEKTVELQFGNIRANKSL